MKKKWLLGMCNAAAIVLIAASVLVLLVVPVQMTFEKLFDRAAALLDRRAERRARRRNARSTFR